MRTFPTIELTPEQFAKFDHFADSLEDFELRELMHALSQCLRNGEELVAFDSDATMTPSQVAERLGMSRTHLYKLLDRGELAFHHVGRDRRIRMKDLVEFERQRQHDRRELAERFAHQQRTAAAADDAIADLL
ncbi:helix-turn-helix domain-containing protein [Propionibacteriaceae bacterium Y1923]